MTGYDLIRQLVKCDLNNEIVVESEDEVIFEIGSCVQEPCGGGSVICIYTRGVGNPVE